MKSFGISVSTAGWKGPTAAQTNSLNSAYSRTFLNAPQPHTNKHLDVKQVSKYLNSTTQKDVS